MNRNRRVSRNVTAALYLWSIRNQDAVAGQIRIHVRPAVASFLLAALLVPIPLEKALTWLAVAGGAFAAGLWVLIERRRSWLLRIQNPELRRAAHRAMADYLQRKIGDENPDCVGTGNGGVGNRNR